MPSQQQPTLELIENSLTAGEELHVLTGRSLGLSAVLSIGTTREAFAMGGTRFMNYPRIIDAQLEMTSHAKAVTLKGAIAGLPCGGAKGAIIGDPRLDKNEKVLQAYGKFVQSLGGRYVLTPDWGMSSKDLVVVARECEFVTGLSPADGGKGSPEPLTAEGVRAGLRGSFLALDGNRELSGLVVAIEGLSMAGPALAESLLDDGAIVYGWDPSPEVRATIQKSLPDLRLVESISKLQSIALDAYVPCAGSGSLTSEFANSADVRVVCGAANGQLASEEVEEILAARGAVYVPEFAVNGGGLVHCYEERVGYDEVRAVATVRGFEATTAAILKTASESGRKTTAVATELAGRRMNQNRKA